MAHVRLAHSSALAHDIAFVFSCGAHAALPMQCMPAMQACVCWEGRSRSQLTTAAQGVQQCARAAHCWLFSAASMSVHGWERAVACECLDVGGGVRGFFVHKKSCACDKMCCNQPPIKQCTHSRLAHKRFTHTASHSGAHNLHAHAAPCILWDCMHLISGKFAPCSCDAGAAWVRARARARSQCNTPVACGNSLV